MTKQDDDFRYELGGRIRAARARKGWSQADLADKASLTPSAVSMYESGKRTPRADSLKRICESLGVPADQLIDTALTDARYGS